MWANKYASIYNSDVTTWLDGSRKITIKEVFSKYGIDIENDDRNRFFWNMQLNKTVVINEDILTWFGYAGKTYHSKKTAITNLLKKKPQIKFNEIKCDCNPRKKYYVLDIADFERLMLYMRTPKILELRELCTLMKTIATKYYEYEKFYELHLAELLHQQNIQSLTSVSALKCLVLSAQEDAEKERRKAEEARRKNEEELRTAEEVCRKNEEQLRTAEKERHRAELERQEAEERNRKFRAQLENNVQRLRNDIAPNVIPRPISEAKRHRLGLYRTILEGEWYLMRRQRENWRDAEQRLNKRSMVRVRIWEDVSHAIDIGNELKRKCRRLTWYARGNIIRVPEEHKHKILEEHLIEMIENILTEENDAFKLANDNVNSLNMCE